MPLLAVSALTLPVTDPVLIVAIAMATFLVVPVLFERLRIPGIIGLLVAGAALGPHGTGVLARDATIVLVGTVGLLYLVFQAALELDLHLFSRYQRRSIVFGALSFAVPMTLALGLMPLVGYGLPAALLFGAIVGSHTLLAYPIVSRLGLAKNAAVTTVVGGTLVTDTLALGVLAVIAGSVEVGLSLGFALRLIAALAVYVLVMMWGVPRLGRWFFRRLPGQAPAEFVFLMAVLFAGAFLARVAGAQPIIGAFLAGLALNRLIPESGPLMNRVRFVGNALFIPFFLLSVGMLVDFRVLAGSARMWIIAGLLTAAVGIGKYVGAAVTRRLFRYSGAEERVMFGLSAPQAAATLAVTFIGLEIGLFDDLVVNAVIVMILITALLGPMVVERAGRRLAMLDEQKPYDPTAAPQRILIPISHPATAEALLDVAFALRPPQSSEPLYPLMVVPESESSDPQVAEAEKMLGHAVIYAAGADVPVVPLTRVDRNVATGIVRGIAESRSTRVVIGWDGRRTGGRVVFGTVLDQLLEQTRQMILVTRLGHPLNTTRRVVLVVPPAMERHPGFVEAVQAVHLLTGRLGATLVGLTVEADAKVVEARARGILPKVPSTWEGIPGWRLLLQRLRAMLRPEDLVVALSARRGTLAWHHRLERLPGQLVSMSPESFVVVYPPEAGEPSQRPEQERVTSRLEPDRVVRLEDESADAALHRMVAPLFPEPLAHDVARALAENARRHSTEILPGVVLPHTRVPGIERARLVVGFSRDGVAFPHARMPARVVLALVSPAERAEEHLRFLAEIAGELATSRHVEALLERFAPDMQPAADAHG